MTPQTELEIQGNFFKHPFVELATEIRQARLTGSLRATDKIKKWVIYFKAGQIVFGVSNSRESRLFDIVLRRKLLSREDLSKYPNFSNDLEFAANLEQRSILTKSALDELFVEQIKGIIIDALSWKAGDWTFSSLMRIRDGLSFEIDTQKLLVDYARCLPDDEVLGRFRSLDEGFTRSARDSVELDLAPEEAFVLSGIASEPRSASQIVGLAALPEAKALHAIYILWISGWIVRDDWRSAFSDVQTAAMRGARLELKREAKYTAISTLAEETIEEVPIAAEADEPEFTMSLEEYLDQVENAATFYDLLGVDPAADTDELKRAYFRLARSFHPDRYHSEGGALLKRMQNAFTELAQAHETLKNPQTREMYDYRIRKELADREKRAGGDGENEREIMDNERASENFETGFSLLMEGEVESSIPFLARAAHFGPKNARYRAYYGKALSSEESQRHKAESEIQTAIRLDPNNPTFKILLAEFFIQFNLLKRAEGELTRLLAVFPSNRDAQALMDQLRK